VQATPAARSERALWLQIPSLGIRRATAGAGAARGISRLSNLTLTDGRRFGPVWPVAAVSPARERDARGAAPLIRTSRVAPLVDRWRDAAHRPCALLGAETRMYAPTSPTRSHGSPLGLRGTRRPTLRRRCSRLGRSVAAAPPTLRAARRHAASL